MLVPNSISGVRVKRVNCQIQCFYPICHQILYVRRILPLPGVGGVWGAFERISICYLERLERAIIVYIDAIKRDCALVGGIMNVSACFEMTS